MEIAIIAPLATFFIAIYLGLLGLGTHALLKMFLGFSILTIVWGWFGGLLPSNLRNYQFIILIPIYFALLRGHQRFKDRDWKTPLVVVSLLFVVSLLTLGNKSNLFFQILTSGYDHNGHIAHFYRTYINNGFAFDLHNRK
jgi:hypothetical protein